MEYVGRVDRSDVERSLTRALLANDDDIVICYEPDLSVRWVTDSLEAVLGWAASDVVGTRFELLLPEDRARALDTFEQARRNGDDSYRLRARALCRDGSVRWVSAVVSVLRRGDGDVEALIAHVHDITAQVETEGRLIESEERYRLLAENSADVVFRGSPAAVIEWISPAVTDVLGFEPGHMIGRPIAEFIHPDDLVGMRQASLAVNEGGATRYTARLRTALDRFEWVSVTARPLRDETGAIVGRVGSARNVDAEVRARLLLEATERRFRDGFLRSPTPSAMLDVDGRFLTVSDSLCVLLGRDREWLVRRTIGDVISRGHAGPGAEPLGPVGIVSSEPVTITTASGDTALANLSVGALAPDGAAAEAFVAQFVAVTDDHLHDELRFQANHDALTHLMNRRGLFDRAAVVMSHTPRTGASVGFLFIDIDGLKPINDTYGHTFGDQVIVETARRLSRCVRGDDVVARFGGDEFVVLLAGLHGVANAVTVAGKMHDVMTAPIVVGDHEVSVSLSIGVSLAAAGADPAAAIHDADVALYAAKRQGRARTALSPGR